MDLTGTAAALFNSTAIVLSLIVLLSAGCGKSGHNAADTPKELLRAPDGWKAGDLQADYNPANLYEYLDGGAERYLGYGFRELHVAEFISSDNQSTIRAELYRMDCAENAYGIFSSDRAGDNPGDVGSDAALGDYLLQFWQGPYFVRIQDIELTGGLREQIAAFGRQISRAIPFPAGKGRPALLGLLPEKGLIPGSVCYFHTLNSLNSIVYLGNDNTLLLSDSTEALTAEYYSSADSQAVSRVVIVLYPDSSILDQVIANKPDDDFGFHPANSLDGWGISKQLLTLYFDAPDDGWLEFIGDSIHERFFYSRGGHDGK